nr:hypothetical protein [Tanacetum cinerariifolium]
MSLPQYCIYGEIACVAHKLKWQVPVWGNQDWSFRKFFLQCLESLDIIFGENERGILLEKMSHRSRDFGEILNESPVETGVNEKTLNTLDGRGMSVVSFRIVYRLTSIVNRLEVFLMSLLQDCTYGEITCVAHKLEWQKMSHRSRDFGEILNESPVKTGMTEEASDTLDDYRMRQFSNDIDFGSVHLNPIFGDFMAEDNALFDHKVTFLPV